MKKRYFAIAALLALPFGQASADVIPQAQALSELERHPASLPTANFRGGKWEHASNRFGGAEHGSWGGAWSGTNGKGCTKVVTWVKVKDHPVWGYPIYRPSVKKVCPSPH